MSSANQISADENSRLVAPAAADAASSSQLRAETPPPRPFHTHGAAWKTLGAVHVIAGAATLTVAVFDVCTVASTSSFSFVATVAGLFVAAGIFAIAMARYRNVFVLSFVPTLGMLSAAGASSLICLGAMAVNDRSSALPAVAGGKQYARRIGWSHAGLNSSYADYCTNAGLAGPGFSWADVYFLMLVSLIVIGAVEVVNGVGSTVLYCRSVGLCGGSEYDELLDGDDDDDDDDV